MRITLFDLAQEGHHLEYARYLAKYLASRGDIVTFVTWRPERALLDSYPLPPEVQVRFLALDSEERRHNQGSVFRRSLRYHRALRAAAQSEADIFHALSVDRNEPALWLWVRSLARDRLSVFGTFFWPYFTAHRTSNPLKRIYHQANRLALRKLLGLPAFAGLFVHSSGILERLRRSLGEANVNKIRVVPDPVEQAALPDRGSARKHLGISPEIPLLLFFGGLRKDKGLDLLFQALPLVDGNWRLIVAGRPLDFGATDIEEWSSHLSSPEHVFAKIRFIPSDEMRILFAAADFVVLPYRRSFLGTSGILQRAAAAGVPVIGTDVGEIGPAIREYGLGIVCSPESPASMGEALTRAIRSQPYLLREAAQRAGKYAEISDWRVMGERVRAGYLEALSEREEER